MMSAVNIYDMVCGTMNWAIETDNVSKRYGNVTALDRVNLQVAPGEIFGFLGPNGAGKTTFIKILLNLCFADAGSAKLYGIDSRNVSARKNVGFLPETSFFYDTLTVEEFLKFEAQLIGLPKKNLASEVARRLKKLDIIHEGRKKLGTLSKGTRQRVSIAQALLNEPNLLLLDEPTSGLDPIGIKEMRDIILELKSNGTTVFINSHLLSEVERTCDRVAIIHKGRIIQSGNKDDLSNKEKYLEITGSGITDSLIEQINAASKKPLEIRGNKIKLYLDSEHDALAVHHVIVNGGGKIESLTWVKESLEDIFYRVIKNEEQ